MAWLSGWGYRKPLVVTGGASGAQTDFQLDIAIAHAAAKMQADFDDIRFTQANGTTLIDAWLEAKVDTTSADTWVEFPTTPANTVEQTYYMYYGNSGAAGDWDIGDTFLFGDDFLGSTLDTSKWDDITVGGSFGDDIANSVITMECSAFPHFPSNGEGIRSVVGVVNSPIITQFRYRAQGSLDGQILQVHPSWAWDSFDSPVIYHRGDANVYHEDIGGWEDHLYTRSRDTSWHTSEMRFTGSNLKYYEDGSLVGTGNESTAGVTNYKIILGSWEWGGGGELEVDWVHTRKYAANPPTYEFGAEETEPTGAIMNQLQKYNLGADLYNGALA